MLLEKIFSESIRNVDRAAQAGVSLRPLKMISKQSNQTIAATKAERMCACLCCCMPSNERTVVYVT